MNETSVRAIVIDDEPLARRDLVAQLAEAEGIEVVGEASGGKEGIRLAETVHPEVAFVDIRMPEVDGLEVAMALERSRTAVVFVTGFDHFAVRAFELGTLDYLTKPVAPERLAKTLDRLKGLRGREPATTLSGFLQSPPGGTFVFRSMGSIVVLEYGEVLYVEARGNYVNVHGLVNDRPQAWLRRSTMDAIQTTLEPHGFLRTHRSILVNQAHLLSIRARGRTYEAELTHGTRVPVSREMARKLR